MNTTTALPPKGIQVRCMRCGLVASSPIVVKTGGSPTIPTGRCSNVNACEQRERRETNRIKASRGER